MSGISVIEPMIKDWKAMKTKGTKQGSQIRLRLPMLDGGVS